MSSDKIINWNSAIIQHGNFNNRIYLMDPGDETPAGLCEELKRMSNQYAYDRIMAKVPLSFKQTFLRDGFVEEARIPNLFGLQPGVYLSKFLTKERIVNIQEKSQKEILDQVLIKAKKPFSSSNKIDDLEIVVLDKSSIPEISKLLSDVFPTYPFPVEDHSFIEAEMVGGTVYYGVKKDDELIAMSSSECKKKHKSAECTDFSTLEGWRGCGLAQTLLGKMSEDLKDDYQLFTIARANEFGMNLVFARAGWKYAGTLKNSTNIGGQIESMNIWYQL